MASNSAYQAPRSQVTADFLQSVPKMANLVRRAEVDGEKATLTAFLSSYLSPDANEARYEWLYCKNPQGMARVWVACELETGMIIGVAAAFPRRIHRHGKEVRGYVLGDFCIHPDYRSLGPALALQRSSLEDLSREGAGFVFDFPSTSMLAIYKRLRIEPQESVIRFAKPLRANRQIHLRIPNEAARSSLAVVANAALRLRDVGLKRSSAWTISEETGPCGEEFTLATQRWALRMDVCAGRNADYLNWRFLQHPQRRYQFLTARKDGRLCGFLIYHWSGEDATVVDLFAEGDPVCKALLVETIAIMRRKNVNTLSAPFLASHAGREILEDCGFQPRESTPVVLLTLPWAGNRQDDQDTNHWYLTHGDRES
jgi:GNAT superfamily N-acetyltransferase